MWYPGRFVLEPYFRYIKITKMGGGGVFCCKSVQKGYYLKIKLSHFVKECGRTCTATSAGLSKASWEGSPHTSRRSLSNPMCSECWRRRSFLRCAVALRLTQRLEKEPCPRRCGVKQTMKQTNKKSDHLFLKQKKCTL